MRRTRNDSQEATRRQSVRSNDEASERSDLAANGPKEGPAIRDMAARDLVADQQVGSAQTAQEPVRRETERTQSFGSLAALLTQRGLLAWRGVHKPPR